MSWLARSLANSLKLDDDDEEDDAGDGDGDDEHNAERNPNRDQQQQEQEDYQLVGASDSPRGVKEDLSELTKTLTRQLRGVASFLAPPPSEPSSSPLSTDHRSDFSDDRECGPSTPRISGTRGDFAEIRGNFEIGISRRSNNKTVTEIANTASDYRPFESEELWFDAGAVGVTEEVLTFARNISMHPETWLDFPLFVDDEYSDDFDMSDAQQDHALVIECLLPRLAALRIELCPSHMSEGCFWKIYFVLLYSRLNKHDAELLSTPQIVEARGMLMELQNRTKPPVQDMFGRAGTSFARKDPPEEPFPMYNTHYETIPPRTFAFEPTPYQSHMEFEAEKYPVANTHRKVIDKSVVAEVPTFQTSNKDIKTISLEVFDQKSDEDGDDWLEDDYSEIGSPKIPLGMEEDVSFSDLEDFDDRSPPISTKTGTDISNISKGSRELVEISESSGDTRKVGGFRSPSGAKEANDWLDNDIDTV